MMRSDILTIPLTPSFGGKVTGVALAGFKLWGRFNELGALHLVRGPTSADPLDLRTDGEAAFTASPFSMRVQ